MKRFAVCLSILLMILGQFSSNKAQSADKPAFDESSLEFFEKEVRPILMTRCYECHSASKGTVKGGLRLDSRDAVLRGGDTGPAVALEKPESSLLVSAINYGDIYQMPPKSKLPASEIAVLTRWVEKGLPWPEEAASSAGTVKPFDLEARAAEHWCWKSVKDAAPPSVNDAKWPVSTIDHFILAKLESRGIAPAEPANKLTLLRRVYFDLIGLPPSPEEVEEFVHDQDPKALEKIVDRLLETVHFGERWGRHWLDLTRYGETRGHEFDPAIPNAWQYRDYVIRALNADVPYDRFLIEHLAGDLVVPRWRLAPPEQPATVSPINESPLGTGFWFLGEEVHSPVDIRKDETDRMDNRLDVLSKTFLGLTVACARCHDHKFDAISQRDYYALAGFAISGCYRQIRVDTGEQHRQIAWQLDELRTESQQEIAKSILEASRPVLEKLDRYWLIAKRAIDEVVSPSLPGSGAGTFNESLTESTRRLAAENSLDARLLTNWCTELINANKDKRHPLNQLFATESPKLAASNQTLESIPGIVADFGDPDSMTSIQDGVSFGLQPVKRGQLVLDGPPESPNLHIATIGGWQRDLFWKEISLSPGTEVDHGVLGSFQSYGRMVRTPEFTLQTRNLWYLVRGSVNVYASVNSHTLINGPLHGSLLRTFTHADDQWHWIHHPLDLYQGHRMHIEFSPADQAPCTIALVVQADQKPDLPETGGLETGSGQTVEQRVSAFHKAFRKAASSIIDDQSRSSLLKLSGQSPNHSSRRSVNETLSPYQIALADWFVTHLNLFAEIKIDRLLASRRNAEAELAKSVKWQSSLAPSMLEANGVDEFLLVRGNSNAPKELVSRRFLEVFQGADEHHSARVQPQGLPQQTGQILPDLSPKDRVASGLSDPSLLQASGRLVLAHEILKSSLASRVAVNRIWHHLFGRGIVPTVDNMGILGLPPSHPELLDHLATQFIRDGWSVKRLIRSMILSRTYQMSSHPTDADAVDPDNELWHRMPIKRLEGEAIRDSLLAVSGRLDRTAFGPSVPIHLTEFMQGRGRPGTNGPLDGNGRRSIYIAVRRNFLSPMMLAFDTPSPFSTVGRRTISNVPAQALILMNDPFVIEQGCLFAERLLSDQSQSAEQRLDRLYLTAFARHPTTAEISEALKFLDAQIQNQPGNQREAWGHLCHVMFNVKEFVFID